MNYCMNMYKVLVLDAKARVAPWAPPSLCRGAFVSAVTLYWWNGSRACTTRELNGEWCTRNAGLCTV